MIGSGATVIDVRTDEEYADGHLDNAHLIPVEDLPKRIGEVAALVKSDKTAPIVVYCKSGRRAANAQRILSEAGYSNGVNGGGLRDLR
jgi:phage shock protein E